MGMSMDTDVDTNMGTGTVMLTLALQLPKALPTWCSMPVAPVQCPALQCHVRHAMALDSVPLPRSPAGGCEHP